MQTPNHKTKHFPRIKRLSKYFSVIVVICSINLAVIKAEEPTKESANKNLGKTETTQIDENTKFQMLCHQIYNNAQYLLELARINQLTNFRSLKKGQKLQFPTIDKEADSDNE